jgi:PKHD-type hydroxylase
MLVHIPQLLDEEEVASVLRRLAGAAWTDGRVTAGHQSAQVKANLQVEHEDAVARELRDTVLRALERSATFVSAALPRHVFPPLFNRYDVGMGFGDHIDNALRPVPGTSHRLRTDLSATLFLTAPQEYDGGELIIEDTYGTHALKHPAGDLVVYSSSSVHRVSPVTRGARIVSVFWVQSMIRDETARALLFEMDRSIGELTRANGQTASIVRLTACYHNLVRRWSDG